MSEDLSISDDVMEKMCAAAFRSLCDHLRQRSDEVQNIDFMSISGFCRNCLAKVCLIYCSVEPLISHIPYYYIYCN